MWLFGLVAMAAPRPERPLGLCASNGSNGQAKGRLTRNPQHSDY
jgi:hypothetical protein